MNEYETDANQIEANAIIDISDKIAVPIRHQSGAAEVLHNTLKAKQTPDMIFSAIRDDPKALRDASKKLITYEMCEEAVKAEGSVLKYVPEKLIDRALIEKAVNSDGLAIEYVPEKYITKKLALKAVKARLRGPLYNYYMHFNIEPSYNYYPIFYIPKGIIDRDIVCESVKAHALSIKNVPTRYLNKNICKLAVSQDGRAIQYVPKRFIDESLVDISLDQCAIALEFIPEDMKTKERCQRAFDTDPRSFLFFPLDFITEELCKRVIRYTALLDIGEDNWRVHREVTDLMASIPEKIISDKVFLDFILTTIPRDKLIIILKKSRNDTDEGEEEFICHKAAQYLRKRLKMPSDNDIIKVEAADCSLPEISKNPETSITAANYPAVYDFTNDNPYDAKRIYYITDIHLEHQFREELKNGSITRKRLTAFITAKIDEMLTGIDSENSILLIGGDVSSDTGLSKIFYKILSEKWCGKIISVLGNHELWDGHPNPAEEGYEPLSVDMIVEKYNEQVFVPAEVKLLYNALFVLYKGRKAVILNEDSINNTADKKLKEILNDCSLIILGGIGFSGLNPVYNAESGLYRATVKSLRADQAQTRRFSDVYQKVLKCAEDKQVIVLTHTQVEDWTDKPLNKKWIYINGHTHRNGLILDPDGTTVLYDNQIGYQKKKWKLNSVIVHGWYDPFHSFGDGIYKISKESYLYFNRERGIFIKSFKSNEEILMLKRNEIYMFLLRSNGIISLLAGGKTISLRYNDPEYYYYRMESYYQKMTEAVRPFYDRLYRISNEVKKIGGSGRVHGCIVDISFFSHLYLNIEDGSLTPYYAFDTVKKMTYPDIRSLLEENEPDMYRSYLVSKDEGLISLLDEQESMQNEIQNTRSVPVYVSETDIYDPSRKMKSIQYMIEQKVIRVWYDDLIEPDIKQEQAHLPMHHKKSIGR